MRIIEVLIYLELVLVGIFRGGGEGVLKLGGLVGSLFKKLDI